MLQKTVRIVLHMLKYGDTSNVVEMYTELLGRASFLVAMLRFKKAAVKSVLFQPLTLIEFEADCRPSTSPFRIKGARSFNPFASIPYDSFKSAIVLFLAGFLYRATREEAENRPLFAYLQHSILWLDARKISFANFHLVFLMRLSRFLGLYLDSDDYHTGDYLDMLDANFTSVRPQLHSYYIQSNEAGRLLQLMRMNYETMRFFGMNRTGRTRCLAIINEYYRLHLPDFPVLRSSDILKELFDQYLLPISMYLIWLQ